MLKTESKLDFADSSVKILIYCYLSYKIVTLGFAVISLCKKFYRKIVSANWNWNFKNKLTAVTLMCLKYMKSVIKALYQIARINNVITEKETKALAKFKETISGLNKIPNHAGIIIPPKEFNSKTNFNKITKAASKEISWLNIAGVNHPLRCSW